MLQEHPGTERVALGVRHRRWSVVLIPKQFRGQPSGVGRVNISWELASDARGMLLLRLLRNNSGSFSAPSARVITIALGNTIGMKSTKVQFTSEGCEQMVDWAIQTFEITIPSKYHF